MARAPEVLGADEAAPRPGPRGLARAARQKRRVRVAGHERDGRPPLGMEARRGRVEGVRVRRRGDAPRRDPGLAARPPRVEAAPAIAAAAEEEPVGRLRGREPEPRPARARRRVGDSRVVDAPGAREGPRGAARRTARGDERRAAPQDPEEAAPRPRRVPDAAPRPLDHPPRLPRPALRLDGAALQQLVPPRLGRKRVRSFQLCQAPISIGFHSIWLILGRAIISRGVRERWSLSLDRVRPEHPRRITRFLPWTSRGAAPCRGSSRAASARPAGT